MQQSSDARRGWSDVQVALLLCVEALCLFAFWPGTNLAADSLGVGMYMGATDPAVVYYRAVENALLDQSGGCVPYVHCILFCSIP